MNAAGAAYFIVVPESRLNRQTDGYSWSGVRSLGEPQMGGEPSYYIDGAVDNTLEDCLELTSGYNILCLLWIS